VCTLHQLLAGAQCAPYVYIEVGKVRAAHPYLKTSLSTVNYQLSTVNCQLSTMIYLSKTAAQEVKRLKSKNPNSNVVFRLGVEAIGCSGLSYTMAFDGAPTPADTVCESEGIIIAIDPQHLKYLNELTIDYSEDLMGGGFRFDNPNAAQSCSCGNSFSAKE
jgi:iron-sulfur cluster assembly accessory protein